MTENNSVISVGLEEGEDPVSLDLETTQALLSSVLSAKISESIDLAAIESAPDLALLVVDGSNHDNVYAVVDENAVKASLGHLISVTVVSAIDSAAASVKEND